MQDINEELLKIHEEELIEASEKKEMLVRLLANEDFKKLFIEFYTGEEIARCVKLAHTDRADTDELFAKKINNKIVGAGEFNRFMEATIAMGSDANHKLEELRNPVKEDEESSDEQGDINYV